MIHKALAGMLVVGLIVLMHCERVSGESEAGAEVLIPDPSFEETMPPNRFGQVFSKWGGWKYGGEAEFRVSPIARSGKSSCLLLGIDRPKIRMFRELKAVKPGRYLITAYLRGLDIGVGKWKQSTEFAFDDKYMPLGKSGTFGWTKLTYVTDVAPKDKIMGPSFGLMATGRLWIDDVTMEKVGPDMPLTEKPILSSHEEPFARHFHEGAGFKRCPHCAYKNGDSAQRCYACGEDLPRDNRQRAIGPPVKLLESYEEFDLANKLKAIVGASGRAATVKQHATDGHKSLRLESGYTAYTNDVDWSSYDFLNIDLFVEGTEPLKVEIVIKDAATDGYWTRVNYYMRAAPGKSVIRLPLDRLYVGEKSRPGRKLQLRSVTKMTVSVGKEPKAPLFIDNIRLERDTTTASYLFDGLHVFDLGPHKSPLMPGFTRLSPMSVYTPGRGFGLMDARIWRSYDVLQPEPLYQDFLCIEKGGVAIDLPSGEYHVMVNLDNPSGYWGEFQTYSRRAVWAEGRKVVDESMTFETLKNKYFRNWDTEDSPHDDVFEKYQLSYYDEKRFVVQVTDGQLNLEFEGKNWANSVSAIIVYPEAKRKQGETFVDYVTERRRFYFDNSFKRLLRPAVGAVPPSPDKSDIERGFIPFTRDYMEDVYHDDVPSSSGGELVVSGAAFAGESEPLTVSIHPLRDLGEVTVAMGELVGPATIPSSSVSVGYVSNRLSRVTMDGTVYTIKPRLVVPKNQVAITKGYTRRLWITIDVPEHVPPGVYQGKIAVIPEGKGATWLPVSLRVYRGMLEEVDLPVGPWGYGIKLPKLPEAPEVAQWNREMSRKSLEKLRDSGFTTFSGMPRMRYRGFKDGRPQLDYAVADRQMALARRVGFSMPVVNYTLFDGLDLYHKDVAAMKKAGFADYPSFVKKIFGEIQAHAQVNNWLPVYWNLGDEPIGDEIARSTNNARQYHRAFKKGPPYFTVASSFTSGKLDDAHYGLAKAVHVANLNGHSARAVELIQRAGSDWGYYNDASRWTYGIYMYKAAKQHDMKFRLSWHWNNAAGDPYYALDCREDDYAWGNGTPSGELMMSVAFEREMREGIDDYRYLLTLAKLAKKHKDKKAAALVDGWLSSFELGQTQLGKSHPAAFWRDFRKKIAEAIERLRERAGAK